MALPSQNIQGCLKLEEGKQRVKLWGLDKADPGRGFSAKWTSPPCKRHDPRRLEISDAHRMSERSQKCEHFIDNLILGSV